MQMKTADDALFLPFNGFLKILPPPSASPFQFCSSRGFFLPAPSSLSPHLPTSRLLIPVLPRLPLQWKMQSWPFRSLASSPPTGEANTEASFRLSPHIIWQSVRRRRWLSPMQTVWDVCENVVLAVFPLNGASFSPFSSPPSSFSRPPFAPSPPLFPLTGTGMCCGDNLCFEQGGSASLSLTRAEILK